MRDPANRRPPGLDGTLPLGAALAATLAAEASGGRPAAGAAAAAPGHRGDEEAPPPPRPATADAASEDGPAGPGPDAGPGLDATLAGSAGPRAAAGPGLDATLDATLAGHAAAALAGPAAPGATPRGAPAERYVVRAELGRGGMGRVLEAEDRQFGRSVAVKELLRTTDAAARARFAMEAIVTGNLEHPGITAVYERGERADGGLFYVMRRVAGQTLTQRLADARTLRDRLRLAAALARVAETVAYAHARGVVHRDLKPDNVIVGAHGEAVVLDWGIAKIRGLPGAGPDQAPTLDGPADATVAGSLMGTPAYMAPEQARGEPDEVDERTDVFALGAMLYHLLAGRAPYQGASVIETLALARAAAPPALRAVAPGAHPALRQICERAMAPRKDDRYASAQEFAQALLGAKADALAAAPSALATWAIRVVLAAVVLILGVSLAMALENSSSLRQQGTGGHLTALLAVAGFALLGLELFGRGRWRLMGVGLACAAATLLAGLSTTMGGLGVVMARLRDDGALADGARYRDALTVGVHEVVGAVATAATLAAAQLVLWALVHRHATRARAPGAAGER